ncbi:MAG: sigma 54-interacting transcriptional regulator [Bacteroidota bacterium]
MLNVELPYRGSPAIKRIRSLLKKLSGQTSPLIITGELGVGKFLLATRIHANSLLKNHPFESVDFSNLREHEQRIRLLGGSPPDLPTTRRSVLECPTTVVLKHIDYAPNFLQERISEALFNRTITRLGTKNQQPVRCRIIFISENNPSILSKEGRLLPALYKAMKKYRTVLLPPLEKHKEDIPELVQHFVAQYQIQRYKNIDRAFIELLKKHRWESNILGLKAFIKSYYVPPDDEAIRQKERIEIAKIQLLIQEHREFSLKESFTKIEKAFVRQTLIEYGGKQVKAAQSLGMADRKIRHLLNSA